METLQTSENQVPPVVQEKEQQLQGMELYKERIKKIIEDGCSGCDGRMDGHA